MARDEAVLTVGRMALAVVGVQVHPGVQGESSKKAEWRPRRGDCGDEAAGSSSASD